MQRCTIKGTLYSIINKKKNAYIRASMLSVALAEPSMTKYSLSFQCFFPLVLAGEV